MCSMAANDDDNDARVFYLGDLFDPFPAARCVVADNDDRSDDGLISDITQGIKVRTHRLGSTMHPM